MKFPLRSFLLISAVLLTACGSSPGKDPAPAPAAETAAPTERNSVKYAAEAGNFQSGFCGSRVVWEYNAVVSSCQSMRTPAAATSCKTQAKAFLEKYPGVNCTAEKFNADDHRTARVQAAELQKVVTRITELGF